MEVSIDEKLKPLLRIGVVVFEGMGDAPDGGEQIWREFEALSQHLFTQYQGCAVSEIPGIQDARTLYRSIGIDPTKTRPSSEALLRRSIKGKGVFRVHPLVDLLNCISLRQLLPVGLYDLKKIEGDTVLVTIGGQNAGFDGIRKARVNVDGRMCVVDAAGPFGSPTSDSLRTSIDGTVASALVLLYQSTEGPLKHLENSMETVLSEVPRQLGGKATMHTILF